MRPVVVPLLAVVLASSAIAAPTSALAAATVGTMSTPTATISSGVTTRAAQTSATAAHEVTVGTETFISTSPGAPISPDPHLPRTASPVTVARRFAETTLTSNVAGAGFEPKSLTTVGVGDRVVRLQQTVGGVPVFGGETVVTLNGHGDIVSAASEGVSSRPLSISGSLSSSTAHSIALATVADRAHLPRTALTAGVASKWIFDPRIVGAPIVGSPVPAWRIEVTSPTQPGVRWLVLVDAAHGKTALAVDLINDVLDRTVCSNRNRRGVSETCVASRVVRREGSSSTGEANVDSAYAFAGDTYRFYATVLGRHGIDNHDLPIRSTVKFCFSADDEAAYHLTCPLQNAYWNGSQMVYGDGYASAQDVVAHELTHGVTQYSSNLFYYHESGAINESLSDIFGEFVDQWSHDVSPSVHDTDTASVRWRMGEDLPIGAVRNMADPTRDLNPSAPVHDADRISSPYFYSGEGDSGGVHSNSGVGNKFAVLLTQGGTFNGVAVRGIGLNRAAQIIYRASLQLTSAADYRAFAAALGAGCQALVGQRLTAIDSVIRVGDCDQVTNAIAAVEMDARPALDQRAPMCLAGQVATPVWSDSVDGPHRWLAASASSGQPVDWFYGDSATPYGPAAPYATSGANNLWANDGGVRTDTTMTMQAAVALPISAGSSYAVHFNHAEALSVRGGRTVDGGVVEFSTDNGITWHDAATRLKAAGALGPYTGTISGDFGSDNPLVGRSAFVGHSSGYRSSRFDVSDLAGTTLRLRFRLGVKNKETGDPGDFGWFIDDVSIVRCDGVPSLTSPSGISAVTGNGVALVRWNAVPAARAYRVTSIPDGRTCSTAAAQCLVRGLRNGVAYRFQVRADATGAASGTAISAAPAVPSTVPGRPPSLRVRAGSASQAWPLVTWGTPGSGGATITRYEFCVVLGSSGSCGAWHRVGLADGQPSRTLLLVGLRRGQLYTVNVRARNVRGVGLPAAATFRQDR